MARLVAAPGRIGELTPGAEHDDGSRLGCQPAPARLGQRRLTLEQSGTPLDEHRQAHCRQAAKTDGEAQRGEPRPPTPQEPGKGQQQHKAARRK